MSHRKETVTFFLVVLAGMMGAGAARGSTVVVDTTDGTNFTAGQVFTVSLDGQGFTQDPVDGGGVNLQFNPAVLQVQSVAVDGSTWDFYTSNGTTDNVGGSVSDIAFAAFFNDVTGDFPIATVTFEAVSSGVSALVLSGSLLYPFASNGVAFTPEFASSSVTVNGAAPVPLQAGIWLFVSGLVALGALARLPGRRLVA
jgi:hypothetical protein